MDEDGSIIRQRVINRDYNCDVNAYNRAMDKKRRETFRWQDIHASALVLPEYEYEALRQIEFQLGYRPNRQLTLPHEPFVREALYRYDFVHNDFDTLCNECELHVDNIAKELCINIS